MTELILSSGLNAGVSHEVWKRQVLTQEAPSRYKADEITREQSEEFLNWTAQMFSKTLEPAPYKLDRFSEEQTTEICTFFPDHLITLICKDKQYAPSAGYILFADVSGFTPLCEKYASFGPSGAYHLTATLNNYIGKMVNIIYSYGGDLIKFAGDAFLAIWDFKNFEEIFIRMHDVVKCAVEIQTSLGHFRTEVGILLRVKLAISLGSFLFATIGSKQNASYIIYGLPIIEVKEGERLCSSGDIILSPTAWSLLDPTNYKYEVVKRDYVKVREIIYNPPRLNKLVPRFKRKNRCTLLLKPWKLRERYIELVKEEMNQENFIRPIIFNGELKKYADVFRRFLIRPIVHQIQKGSSVEYLIEMRQVTIMFINIISKDLSASKVTVLVNDVFLTLNKIIEKKLGVINKVCLFDKDIMFLVVFGLKGYKGKDEALRALQCGSEAIDMISKVNNVKSVSIGVTVGTTYCGVVGHPQRKEYTVIGGAVNRAARLMCTFENVVSCDLAVVFNSRLPAGYFKRSRPVYLKGIGIVGNIFIYLGEGYVVKMPVLGRYNTLCKFIDILTKTSPYQCLIIRGDPRVGKSRILHEFQDITEQWQWNSLMISVNQMISTDICLINKLLSSFIGKKINDRMRVLIDTVLEEDLIHLHLLNKILDVNFSVPDNYKQHLMTEDKDNLLKRILRKIFQNTVIIIDDAEDLDNQSWKALCLLIEIPEFVVALAVPNSYNITEVYARELFNSSLSLTINIECLSKKYIGPLICQMLSVDAVPFKLISNMNKISHGSPGWIQTFLLSYVDSATIIVTTEPSNKVSKKLYMIPDCILLKSEIFCSVRKSNLQVCQFMDKKVQENEVPPTFDDVIMATFDKLTPFEQLFLKCGAVLGREFKRHALIYMMEFPSESAVCEAVEVLFKMDILGCANVHRKHKFSEESSEFPFPIAECNCDISVLLNRLAYPKYAFCEFLSFKFSILASTIYQTIPLNQRIRFHTRALSSIKEQIMKCSECIHQEILMSIEKRFETKKIEPLQNLSDEMPNIRVTLESLQRSESFKEFQEQSSFLSRRAAIFNASQRNKLNVYKKQEKTETQLQLDLSALKEMAERRQESIFIRVRTRTEEYRYARKRIHEKMHPRKKEYTDDTFQMYIGDILHILRASDVLRRGKRKKIKRLFEFEFSKPFVINCSCRELGNDVYRKLIYHSRSAELRITELKYLVECAIHYIKYSNYQSALKLLLDAKKLYKTCMNLLLKSQAGTNITEGDDILTLKDLLFEHKKIHCYLGKCYLCVGELQLCLSELNEVTAGNYLFGMEVFWGKFILKTIHFKRKYIEKKRTEIALSSLVYTVLSNLYLLMFLFREAAYAAQIAIHYAAEIKQLEIMASAFAAGIDAYLMIGELKSSKSAEKEALNNCMEVYSEVNNWDLLSLGKVFLAVFKGRVYRGELVKAIEIGEHVINIAYCFKATDVLTYAYPLMMMVLVYLGNLQHINQLLSVLQEPTEELPYEYGVRRHLHITMNLYLLIELGYCTIPPNMLINKIKNQVDPNMIPIDKIECRRIAIYMWMWYLRRKDINNAILWELEPYDNVDLCYENIPSTLVMLQAKLMSTANLIETGIEINDIMVEEMKIKIKKLEWICRNRMPVFLARFYLLKAYKKILWSSFISTFNPAGGVPGLRELRKAVKHAKKCGNQHVLAWTEHCMNVWYSPYMITQAGEVHRKNHYNFELIDKGNIIKYEHDDILYELPLPRKVKRRLRNIITLNKYDRGGWHRKLLRRLLRSSIRIQS